MKTVQLINKQYPIICGIYKLDFPNGKIYIGQSRNIYKRILDHNRYAKQGHGQHNIQVCEKAIQKYGEITSFIILEEINDLQLLDERESYWIHYFDSCNKNKGYNIIAQGNASHKAGVENTNAAFNEETLAQVIDLLQNHNELSLKDIGDKFNVNQETIVRINTGKSYINPILDYPLRKKRYSGAKKQNLEDYNLTEEKLLNLKYDLLYSWDLNIDNDLTAKYGTSLQVIRDINNGRKFAAVGDYTYPIRKKNTTNRSSLSRQTVEEIIDLLQNTKTPILQIAKQFNISRNTVYNINKGLVYIMPNLTYPLR